MLFTPLRPKHWQKVKTCEAGIKSTETKNCWTLLQKASVIWDSQKRWNNVSCAAWQKQQRFDSENLILNRKEFVAILLYRNLNWKFLNFVLKVTVYLQGCLASKRCSASGLSCRYLSPYIKLKLIELAIKPYQTFWNKMNCQFFHGH